jgi:hypothetical protein
MNKQRRTFHTVRIRFRIELLNYFPVLMITTNDHCSIHFRIIKMSIVETTSITNGRRTSELIKESMFVSSETNHFIKSLSAHLSFSGTNVMYQESYENTRPPVPVLILSHHNSGSIRISPNFPTFRCGILTKDNLINLFLYPFVILFIIANLLIE